MFSESTNYQMFHLPRASFFHAANIWTPLWAKLLIRTESHFIVTPTDEADVFLMSILFHTTHDTRHLSISIHDVSNLIRYSEFTQLLVIDGKLLCPRNLPIEIGCSTELLDKFPNNLFAYFGINGSYILRQFKENNQWCAPPSYSTFWGDNICAACHIVRLIKTHLERIDS